MKKFTSTANEFLLHKCRKNREMQKYKKKYCKKIFKSSLRASPVQVVLQKEQKNSKKVKKIIKNNVQDQLMNFYDINV